MCINVYVKLCACVCFYSMRVAVMELCYTSFQSLLGYTILLTDPKIGCLLKHLCVHLNRCYLQRSLTVVRACPGSVNC